MSKYYKDKSNQLFVDPIVENHTGLVEITKAEFDAMIAPTFSELQIAKINEIKQAFTTATKSGYICSNNITMDADLTSIQTLDSGYNLAVKLGATTMDITDYSNVDHLALSIADVDTMIIELGMNYNIFRVKKNTLKKQAEVAKTQTELDAIVW